jgi:hypothetical protein
MKNLFRSLTDMLTDAALLEEGIRLETVPTKVCDPFAQTLEENLMEVAFAEAADYEDIHTAILNEHLRHCSAAS